MSPSLRFALLLVGLTALAAPVSIYGINRQAETRARITAEQTTGGHVDAGKSTMERYGCGACHEIPGIAHAHGSVGPSLDGFAGRAEIAGLLANQPESLILWLRHPQEVSPGTGMPDQGVTEQEGQDMAAYLYTLR